MRIAERKREQSRANWALLWRSLEGLGIVIAIGTGFLALKANQIAADSLKDQRIAAAWQMMSAPNGAGRRYALEALVNDTDEALDGIDFSCKQSEDEKKAGTCKSPTRLDRIKLTPAPLPGGAPRTMHDLNLDFADLSDGIVRNMLLVRVSLEEAVLANTSITNTWILSSSIMPSGNIFGDRDTPGALITDSEILATQFRGFLTNWVFVRSYFLFISFAGAVLADTTFDNIDWTRGIITEGGREILSGDYPDIDISGTVFCRESDTLPDVVDCTKGLDSRFFARAFFVGDAPPDGLASFGLGLQDIAHCEKDGRGLKCSKADTSWFMGDPRVSIGWNKDNHATM